MGHLLVREAIEHYEEGEEQNHQIAQADQPEKFPLFGIAALESCHLPITRLTPRLASPLSGLAHAAGSEYRRYPRNSPRACASPETRASGSPGHTHRAPPR